MRIIAKRTIREFWALYPDAEGPLQAWYSDAEGPLQAWYSEVSKANWQTPQQLKVQFGSASILKGGRVVFNIAGNKYRIILAMDYGRQACFIKFIGTHRQYDAVDAETV